MTWSQATKLEHREKQKEVNTVTWKWQQSAFPKILSKKLFIFINNVLYIGKTLLFDFILCYIAVLASWLVVGANDTICWNKKIKDSVLKYTHSPKKLNSVKHCTVEEHSNKSIILLSWCFRSYLLPFIPCNVNMLIFSITISILHVYIFLSRFLFLGFKKLQWTIKWYIYHLYIYI